MKRREFLTLVGGVATVLPSHYAAWAQQKIPSVGFLNSASPDTYRFNADPFEKVWRRPASSRAECPY